MTPEIAPESTPATSTDNGSGVASAATGSPVVAWQKGVLRVRDKDDLDCTDLYILVIDGRTVLRAIVPSHGLGLPVSDADRKLIGQALADYLANTEGQATAKPLPAPDGSAARISE